MPAKTKGATKKTAKRTFTEGRLVRFMRQEGGYGVGEVVEVHQADGNGSAKVRTGDGKELVIFAAEVC